MASHLSDVNEVRVAFLLVELDLAMAFMDVAHLAKTEERALLSFQNALKAYHIVARSLPKVRPDPEQRRMIKERLAHLRARLDVVGYQV